MMQYSDVWTTTRLGRSGSLRLTHMTTRRAVLERSKKFYELLGFQEVRALPEGSDPAMDAALGLPEGTRGKASIMSLDPAERRTTRIDLVEWTSPRPFGQPYASLLNLGIARIALVVTGLRGEYERLTAAGVVFLSEPMQMRRPAMLVACAKDPDGSIIEMMEFAAPVHT
jgi:glyoxylase I family protein